MKEPDRSRGGTFVRDRNGVLVEYIPPTAPYEGAPVPTWTPPAPAATPPNTTKPAPRRPRGTKE